MDKIYYKKLFTCAIGFMKTDYDWALRLGLYFFFINHVIAKSCHHMRTYFSNLKLAPHEVSIFKILLLLDVELGFVYII